MDIDRSRDIYATETLAIVAFSQQPNEISMASYKL